MMILLILSAIANGLLILALWAFLTFGACYNGCHTPADYAYLGFLLPLFVPLAASLVGIRRRFKTRPAGKFPTVTTSAFGGLIFAGSIWLAVADRGDAFIYLIFTGLAFGLLAPGLFAGGRQLLRTRRALINWGHIS